MWNSGDVFKLQCGFGVCTFIPGEKYSLHSEYRRDQACTRDIVHHSCTVTMLEAYEEGAVAYEAASDARRWMVLTPKGVAFIVQKRSLILDLMEREVIKKIG
jgi:hypothetical protein